MPVTSRFFHFTCLDAQTLFLLLFYRGKNNQDNCRKSQLNLGKQINIVQTQQTQGYSYDVLLK